MKEKELLEPIGIWSKKGMGMTAEVKAFAELRMIVKVKPTVLIINTLWAGLPFS